MKTLWLVLCLLCIAAAVCHADRDIVYSARYYAPPGSRQTSHLHIYRINPDGTSKTQLTFGTGDEEFPQWSADGRQVTFVAYRVHSDVPLLCRMDAGGSGQRVLRTLGENEALPAPPTPGYRLENAEPATDAGTVTHTLIVLKTGRRILLNVPAHDDDNDALLPMPGSSLVYAANNHNSTVGTEYAFYRLNPSAGTLKYLTEGQFLAWEPNGARLCAAPGRDTTPYEHRRGRDDRLVWFAPLYVRAASGGPMRQITPRLSYVSGADWRKVK